MSRYKARFALHCFLVVSCCIGAALADSNDDRRLRTGAKLFRALLAADLGLEDRVGSDGRLHILVVTDDPGSVEEISDLIGGGGGTGKTIRGIPLSIEFTSQPKTSSAPVGAIFLAVNSSRRLTPLIDLGIKYNTVVYSPFEGHVEQGVLAGLSVEARVRPYVNKKTLEASKIKLKPFFLSVARIYE